MASISIVIPTRNRPRIVCRAVQSVLQQTYADFEIVVVIDGHDPETVVALAALQDERIRLIPVMESVGGGEARNIGIRAATGKWVALLDDDDEWFPEKLAEQLSVAEREGPDCFVACRYIDRRANADIVQPFLSPKDGQPISEYLFSEVSFLGFRSGFLQTSTWLGTRRSFLAVPFRRGLARNQDTDWLLRAIPTLGLRVHIVWQPLAIFHNESSVGRITSKSDWRYSMNWAIETREFFTPKAFAFFIALVCPFASKLQGDSVRELGRQLQVARRYGRVSPKCLWLFFANWFIFSRGGFGIKSKLQNFLSSRMKPSVRPLP